MLQVKIERKRSKRASPEQLGAGKAPATAQKTVLDLAFAMNMYDLTGSELFCEVKRDTRCLMGWSDSTVVLAFRGTASMTNALSDLQVVCLSRLLAGCVYHSQISAGLHAVLTQSSACSSASCVGCANRSNKQWGDKDSVWCLCGGSHCCYSAYSPWQYAHAIGTCIMPPDPMVVHAQSRL